jgi:hypothetical protein
LKNPTEEIRDLFSFMQKQKIEISKLLDKDKEEIGILMETQIKLI